MRPGVESKTAVMVCMGRALAHGTVGRGTFSDPTAFALLPEEARRRVEGLRAGRRPKGWRERFGGAHLDGLSKTMVARTVAIDGTGGCSEPTKPSRA